MGAADRLIVNRIAAPVTSLGPGRRVGLWVQGCSIGCRGCASTDTWDPDAGTALTVEEVTERLESLLDGLDGLTISGGEPFQQGQALAAVVAGLRSRDALVERDVLLFTGYAQARARRLSPNLWTAADAVVSGPYLRDRPGGEWLRASANQVLILRTGLARERYTDVPGRRIDVGTAGSDLTMAGLPRPGDLDRFTELMAARGIRWNEGSWQN